MIFADSTEYSANSLMPQVSGIVQIDGLEKITGADFLISALTMPATTEVLIAKHLESGGILVQRKSGTDLINSIMDGRLMSSLSKMCDQTQAHWQRLLITTGIYTPSTLGYSMVDGLQSTMSYISIMAMLDAWQMRGGSYINLINDEAIPDFLITKERRVKEFRDNNEKIVFDPPLQTLVSVRDWRVTLATFPMIGEKKALAIGDFLNKNPSLSYTLLDALMVVTGIGVNKPPGIGSGITAIAREWLGLEDGWELTIKPSETEV